MTQHFTLSFRINHIALDKQPECHPQHWNLSPHHSRMLQIWQNPFRRTFKSSHQALSVFSHSLMLLHNISCWHSAKCFCCLVTVSVHVALHASPSVNFMTHKSCSGLLWLWLDDIFQAQCQVQMSRWTCLKNSTFCGCVFSCRPQPMQLVPCNAHNRWLLGSCGFSWTNMS